MPVHAPLPRLSRILARLCLLAMAAIPLTLAIVWWHLDWLLANAPELQRLPVDPAQVGPGLRVLGFLISMIPASMMVYGLYRLRGAFAAFAAGETFTAGTIAGIRAFALMVVLQALVRPLASAALTVVLTLPNPPGHRVLAIGFGSGQLETLFVGLVFFAVAHLMAEGRRLADDSAAIV